MSSNEIPESILAKIGAITEALNEQLGAADVAPLTAEQRVRRACAFFDADKLVELGIADQLPLFTEGDRVRVLTDLAGEDQEFGEHHLSVDDLAGVEARVGRVQFLPNGVQGWQYEVTVPVRPGEVDEDGDEYAIFGNFDDSDRNPDGTLPLELLLRRRPAV